MLRRQRTILRLLTTADRATSATQIQKYLFLIRKETFLRDDTAFYEFVPYKFGPYSFAAQREIESLVACGYVESKGSSFLITQLGKREANHVDSDTARAALLIFSKYGDVPLKKLLMDVYARYPWYATKSTLEDIAPAVRRRLQTTPIAVYTIGYEESSVDCFLNRLLQAGIRQIVDVRANPVSRKYGFARSALARLAGKLGLEYAHFPELGIPSDRRKKVRTASQFRDLFWYYERQLLPAKADEVAKVAGLMSAAPSALVCMEKEAVDCHRSRLAARIASLTSLKAAHL
jgi:uncharacterized protein (DUF488 family)